MNWFTDNAFFETKNWDEFFNFIHDRETNSKWLPSLPHNLEFFPLFGKDLDMIAESNQAKLPVEIVREAFEHTRLGLMIDNRRIPVGLSSVPKLLEYSGLRAEKYNTATRLSPVVLAEVLNKMFSLPMYGKNETPILVKEGDSMIRTIVSNRYAVLPSTDLFEFAYNEYLYANWPEAKFYKGSWSHDVTTGIFDLNSHRREFMGLFKDFKPFEQYHPALVVENSDTTKLSVRLRPMLLDPEKGTEFPLLNSTHTAHLGAKTIYERAQNDFQMVLANFLDAVKNIHDLDDIRLEFGYNTLIRCLKQPKVALPIPESREVAEEFREENAGSCTALDVYFALVEIYHRVVKNDTANQNKALRTLDAVNSAIRSSWKELDGPGDLSI